MTARPISAAAHAPRRAAPALLARLSAGGLALGLVLFCLSLTPSMVPRPPAVQGALGGIVLALGYAAWVAVRALLRWLGAWPEAVWPARAALALALLAALVCLPLSAEWQGAIRAAWGVPGTAPAAPLRVALLAAFIFAGLVLTGRIFLRAAIRLGSRARVVLPPRLGSLIGALSAVLLFAALFDGVLLRAALRSVDGASQLADSVIAPELAAPDSPLKTGSPASGVAWEDLGRWGRSFIASGPDAEDIAAFWGAPAQEPIRVYIGLNAADTPEARAELAFAELLRTGAFARQTLVIAMPTGSGWIDPGAADSLDYITRGDVAIAAVQYSYLPSPVSVVVDPEHGIAEAQALFDLVYGHWTALPAQSRPALYLHGLSLGAFLSQETLPVLDMFADPIHGALWVGSPFLSDFWRMVVERRQPGSPAWRPDYGNGSLVRTDNQRATFQRGSAPWGPMRLVMLQYGSDPIVFFDWSLAWRRPDWLSGARAPDVAPQMRWIPLVTLFQVGFDMAFALGSLGHGHDYVARDYIPAWAATLDPESWTPQVQARLQHHLRGLVPR